MLLAALGARPDGLEAAPVGQQLRGRARAGGGDRGRRRALPARRAVPADTSSVRILLGTYGRPTPAVEVHRHAAAAGAITAGSLPGGGREGHVVVPLAPVEQETRTRPRLRPRRGQRADRPVRVGAAPCGSSGCGPAARAGSTCCRPSRGASATARPTRSGPGCCSSPGSCSLLAWLLAGRLLAAGSCAREAASRAAARWCALVAFANALVWSLVTPAVPRARRDRARGLRPVPRRDREGSRTSRARRSSRHEESALLDALNFNGVVGKRARPRRVRMAHAATGGADRPTRPTAAGWAAAGPPRPEPAAALLRVRVDRLPRLALERACSSASG